MRLDAKALAIAGALLTGGAVLFLGVLNRIVPGYGAAALDLAASVYPGYEATAGVGSILVGTLYGLIDGAIGGWLLAWLYNLAAGQKG